MGVAFYIEFEHMFRFGSRFLVQAESYARRCMDSVCYVRSEYSLLSQVQIPDHYLAFYHLVLCVLSGSSGGGR